MSVISEAEQLGYQRAEIEAARRVGWSDAVNERDFQLRLREHADQWWRARMSELLDLVERKGGQIKRQEAYALFVREYERYGHWSAALPVYRLALIGRGWVDTDAAMAIGLTYILDDPELKDELARRAAEHRAWTRARQAIVEQVRERAEARQDGHPYQKTAAGAYAVMDANRLWDGHALSREGLDDWVRALTEARLLPVEYRGGRWLGDLISRFRGTPAGAVA